MLKDGKCVGLKKSMTVLEKENSQGNKEMDKEEGKRVMYNREGGREVR